jgi:hypothetical protein
MKNALMNRVCLMFGVLCFGLTLPLAAQTSSTIFDNSSNDLLTRFNPGTLQVGDEIILGTSGGLLADRSLTSFSFEYWGVSSDSISFAGPVQARVEFYLNDGTATPATSDYAPPGTLFWDSGWFGGFGPTAGDTNRATLNFTAGTDFPEGGLWMPVVSNMTWTIQFQGMGTGDSVGVDLYSAPTVGQDYPDYWQNDGSGWTLMTNTVPVDFAAVMQATVPEPSTLVLSVFGGLGLLIAARRLRRQS